MNNILVCYIATGWMDAGKRGAYITSINVLGREWAVVVWDDEDEPETFKREALEVASEHHERFEP